MILDQDTLNINDENINYNYDAIRKDLKKYYQDTLGENTNMIYATMIQIEELDNLSLLKRARAVGINLDDYVIFRGKNK